MLGRRLVLPIVARDEVLGSIWVAGALDDDRPLIEQAARDLADYQRLTAEGRLGEAGAKLEAVKRALDQLARQRR